VGHRGGGRRAPRGRRRNPRLGRDTSWVDDAGDQQRAYPHPPHDHHAADHDAQHDDGDHSDSADHNGPVDNLAHDRADHHDDSHDAYDNYNPDRQHADHDNGRGRNDDYPDGDAVTL
jgi:hypothetical protein